MSLLGLTIETTGQNITLNATASVAAAASNVTTGATGKIASLLDTTGFNITSQLMESHDINTSAGVNGHISYNNTAANKSDPLLFGLPKMDNFVDIFSICCSVAVIFGGLIPYIPQYLKIKRSANSDGFSTYVCLTLFIANILRIMFWFGHHFEPPLLIQSFVMIAGMLAMMELCVRVKDKRRSFSISAIGLGGANHRRRRSLIGKQEAVVSHSESINSSSNSSSGGKASVNSCCSYTETTPPICFSGGLQDERQNQHQCQLMNTPDLQLSYGSSCSQLLDSCSYHHRSQPNAVERSSTAASTSTTAAKAALLSPINALALGTNSERQSDNSSIDAPVGIGCANGNGFFSCFHGSIARSSESLPILNHAVGNGLDNPDELSQQSLGAASLPWQRPSPALQQPPPPQQQQQQQQHPDRTIKCSRARDFWDWDDFFSYIQFISLFTIIMSLLTYLLVDYYLYVETLGYVAVFTEAMLGIPQLIKNHTQKSTLGMSVEMVIMWLSGDLFKTLYFIIKRTPAQFYACGSIQVLVDILILYQVLHFRKPKVTYRKLPESG